MSRRAQLYHSDFREWPRSGRPPRMRSGLRSPGSLMIETPNLNLREEFGSKTAPKLPTCFAPKKKGMSTKPRSHALSHLGDLPHGHIDDHLRWPSQTTWEEGQYQVPHWKSVFRDMYFYMNKPISMLSVIQGVYECIDSVCIQHIPLHLM